MTEQDKIRAAFEAYYNERYNDIDSEFAAILWHCWQACEANKGQAQILKGVAKYSGDGWKDSVKQGDVVYVWNQEKPKPYKEGQYPRINNEIWSASSEQFDFVPAKIDEVAPLINEAFNQLRRLKESTKHKPQANGELVEEIARLWRDRILGKNLFVCQNSTNNPVEQLENGIKGAIQQALQANNPLLELVEIIEDDEVELEICDLIQLQDDNGNLVCDYYKGETEHTIVTTRLNPETLEMQDCEWGNDSFIKLIQRRGKPVIYRSQLKGGV